MRDGRHGKGTGAAHRPRVGLRLGPPRHEDWGLQACTLADLRGKTPSDDVKVYVNTVGTFGFSTAGYWWGRLAAALIRCGHYVLGQNYKIRMMLIADDGKAHIPASSFRRVIPALLALFVSLGMDIKWEKIRGGIHFQWIGYWLALDGFRIGISEKRKDWVLRWVTDVLNGTKTASDFDRAIGRLSFVCSPIV